MCVTRSRNNYWTGLMKLYSQQHIGLSNEFVGKSTSLINEQSRIFLPNQALFWQLY